LRGSLVKITHPDVRARLCKRERDFSSNASSRSGYKRVFSCKLDHRKNSAPHFMKNETIKTMSAASNPGKKMGLTNH
jgi:hypothetical protein